MCRSRMADWNAASAWALKLRKGDESDAQLANILLTLVAVEQEQVGFLEVWAGGVAGVEECLVEVEAFAFMVVDDELHPTTLLTRSANNGPFTSKACWKRTWSTPP